MVTGPSGEFELAGSTVPVRVRVLAAGFETRELEAKPGHNEVGLVPTAQSSFADAIQVEGAPARAGEGSRMEDVQSEAQLRSGPDTSAAEVLQRVAGAIIERDRGEADRVGLRGAESRLVATTLDGERLPSPEGDARSAGVGLIPAELLQEVRVARTFTPDMDGDAVGGVVNLVTRKTPDTGISSTDFSRGWDSEGTGPSVGGSFTVGRRFDDRQMGVLLSTSYQDADRGADRLEARYEEGAVERLELRDYELARERRGMAAATDYSLSQATEIQVKGFLSSLGTDELRRRVKFDLADGEIERELKDAAVERTVASLTLAANQQLARRISLDYRLGKRRASQREPDRVDTSFLQEDVTFRLGGLHPVAPEDQPIRFRLDKIGVENNRTQQENSYAEVNLNLPIRFRELGVLRFGIKGREQSKVQDTNTTIYEPDGDFFLSSFLESTVDDGFLRDQYSLGPMVDPQVARSLIASLDLSGAQSFEEEAADYSAMETTSAAYVMAELAVGPKWSIVSGLRHERTASRYKGFEVVAADDRGDSLVRDLSGDRSYGVWMPGVHVAYSAAPNLVARAAVTRTIARPDYFDLVPYRILDIEDSELELGNADLRPTRSWNIDLNLEWSSEPTDVLVSLFHKAMKDTIYRNRGVEETDRGIFDVAQPRNGGRAGLRGVEVLIRHRFGFRVPQLDGLGLDLNFTLTDSSAQIGDGGHEELRLPGQASLSTGGALTLNKGRVRANLSATYIGDYLLELGDGRPGDIYVASHSRLDFAADFAATDWADIYLKINNVTDAPLRMVQGSSENLYRVEYTGWSGRVGLKLRY